MKLFISAMLLSSVITTSGAFELTSSDIQEGNSMPKTFEFSGFGCHGDNVSPQLSWSGAPKQTKSFAITVYDPDAPTGSGWWHWLGVNIPASVSALPQGVNLQKMGAMELKTDYGQRGFGGACPPVGHGMHRYQFTLWALPVEKLELDKNASAAVVGYTLNSMALGKARLTATYHR